jgi:hypothetical protein
LEAEPIMVSVVQAMPSLQEMGQLPSQVSLASIIEFPQVEEQLLSLAPEQPVGQQPSSLAQFSIAIEVQAALQPVPVSMSAVQEFPSLQAVGHAPGMP